MKQGDKWPAFLPSLSETTGDNTRAGLILDDTTDPNSGVVMSPLSQSTTVDSGAKTAEAPTLDSPVLAPEKPKRVVLRGKLV